MASPNNMPGKPPADPVNFSETDNLYTLDYLRGNHKDSKIFRFPPNTSLGDVVTLSKEYCKNNNFRFVWVEPTVNLMPPVIQ